MCEYMQKEGDTASALLNKPGQILSSALGLGESGEYHLKTKFNVRERIDHRFKQPHIVKNQLALACPRTPSLTIVSRCHPTTSARTRSRRISRASSIPTRDTSTTLPIPRRHRRLVASPADFWMTSQAPFSAQIGGWDSAAVVQ